MMKVASLRRNLPKNPKTSSGVTNEDVTGGEETLCISKAKSKLVVAPHKKHKVVRSQNQTLSHMVKGMQDLA